MVVELGVVVAGECDVAVSGDVVGLVDILGEWSGGTYTNQDIVRPNNVNHQCSGGDDY